VFAHQWMWCATGKSPATMHMRMRNHAHAHAQPCTCASLSLGRAHAHTRARAHAHAHAPLAMVTVPSSLLSSSSLRMASWMWRGMILRGHTHDSHEATRGVCCSERGCRRTHACLACGRVPWRVPTRRSLLCAAGRFAPPGLLVVVRRVSSQLQDLRDGLMVFGSRGEARCLTNSPSACCAPVTRLHNRPAARQAAHLHCAACLQTAASWQMVGCATD
jgi:hypothetical protein